MAVVDNLSGKLTLIVYAEPGSPAPTRRRHARLKELLAKLRYPVQLPAETPAHSEPAVSSFGEAAFKHAVLKAKDYITEGDIMQVVLSQRMSKPFQATPLALYRALRSLEPVALHVLFRLRGLPRRRRLAGDPGAPGGRPGHRAADRRHPQARRFAGRGRRRWQPTCWPTRRSAPSTPSCSTSAATTAVASPDRARCKLTENMTIERYSHVMHIVSNVEGQLQTGLDALDVLRATFPAGTVSGAPKVRAMEIIDELEPVKRGIYAGVGRLPRLQRRHGPGHRHPHRGGQGRQAARPGRRRHRCRFEPDAGVAGNPEQGSRRAARRRDWPKQASTRGL